MGKYNRKNKRKRGGEEDGEAGEADVVAAGAASPAPAAGKTSTGGDERPENLAPDMMPKRRFYRQRAHANPFSDHNVIYPTCPEAMNWAPHYPEHFTSASTSKLPQDSEGVNAGCTSVTGKKVEWVDIGCGFGGLVCALAPLFPDTLMLGMEIRITVTQYVNDKVVALRLNNPGQYNNVSAMRANTMKFLPNFFEKGQLTKMFFLFPDPHFKARKHKARIITSTLLAEYAYVMAPGGLLYTISDVPDLAEWMGSHLDGFPAFERLSDEELADDKCLEQVREATEEGQKVTRNNGLKMWRVYRRKAYEDEE